jgi:small subunit ribosomal protein S2
LRRCEREKMATKKTKTTTKKTAKAEKVTVKAKKASKKKESKYELQVTLEDLLKAGSHFGHQSRRWNPKMEEYIWKDQSGVHIFDLLKTIEGLEKACKFLYQAAKEGKSIVMIGAKRQAKDIVKEEAEKAEIAYVCERWLGGSITNFNEIWKRVKRMKELEEILNSKEDLAKYTKKEQVLMGREKDKLARFVGGLERLDGKLPEVVIIIDTHRERTALREALSKELSVVGLVDSNGDPEGIEYVIPANDDAVRSIKLVVEELAKAIIAGKNIK